MSDLFAELREAGKLDSSGHFTLDKRKAQEKMQLYQLVDPHLYVLQLIAAAVASARLPGQSESQLSIDVDTDARGATVTINGWEVGREFLEQPLAGLFIAQDHLELQAYRALSIGLNAALALKPRMLEVRSGFFRLEIESAEKFDLSHCSDRPSLTPLPNQTVIRIQERWSWRTVVGSIKLSPEGQAVLQKGRWCPVPLWLNATAVTAGSWLETAHHLLEWMDAMHASAAFETPSVKGMLAYAGAKKARVFFVKNGVLVCERALDLPPLHPVAVVYTDACTTNASESDIVEDETYKAIILKLTGECNKLIPQLCEWYADADETERQPLRERLLRLLMARGIEGDCLRDVPLFWLEGEQAISARDLIHRVHARHVLYYVREPLHPPYPMGKDVVLADELALTALQGLFGDQLRPLFSDTTPLQRQQNIERWKYAAGRAGVELAFGRSYAVVDSFDEQGFGGEIGLPYLDGAKSRKPVVIIAFYLDDKLLCTREVNMRGLCFDATVQHPDFTPTPAFDGVEENQVYHGALQFLAYRFGHACERLCGGGGSATARFHLTSLIKWLPANAKPLTAFPAPLLDLPLFPVLDGRLVSLRDVQADLESYGQIRFVPKSPGTSQLHPGAIVVGEENASILRNVFGSDKVKDYTLGLQREQRELELQWRPKQTPSLRMDTLVSLDFRCKDMVGVVGLLGAREDGGNQTVLHLLGDGKVLEDKTTRLEMGPLEAAVDCPRLRMDEDIEHVVEDSVYQEVLDAIRHAARDVAAKAAGNLVDMKGPAIDLLSGFLFDCIAAFPADVGDAVLRAPLFLTMDNTYCSLRQVRAELSANSHVRYVKGDVHGTMAGGSLILKADGDKTLRRWRAVLGDLSLVDATAEVKQELARAQFLALPQEEATLPRAAEAYILWVPLPQLNGHIGILPAAAGYAGKSSVRVLRESRPLGTIEIDTYVAVEAVVNSDQVEPASRWSGVAEASVFMIAQAVNETIEHALSELEPPQPHSPRARLLIAYALKGGVSARRLLSSEEDRRFMELPLLRDTTSQPLSLSDVAHAFRSEHALYWAPPDVHTRPLRDIRVASLDADEVALLERTFAPAVDYSEQLHQDEIASRLRERGSQVNLSIGEGEYFARLPLKKGLLQGELAISVDGARGVTLAYQQVSVETRPLFGYLPVVGVVQSQCFQINERGTAVTWDGDVAAALQDALDKLFDNIEWPAWERAPSVLLAYFLYRRQTCLDWAESRRGKLPSAASTPIFPLCGGGRTSLRDLLEGQHGGARPRGMPKRILYATHPMEPTKEPVVLCAEAKPFLEFLRDFFGGRLEKADGLWAGVREAAQHAVELLPSRLTEPIELFPHSTDSPTPAQTRKERQQRRDKEARERKKRLKAEAQQHREDNPLSRECSQAARWLRDCFASLGQHGIRIPAPLQHFSFVDLGPTLLVCADKDRVSINSVHPIVCQILKTLDSHPAQAAYLASIAFSAANQGDRQEMEFLQHLLDCV